VVLLTVMLRISYPYELEWMEGGVLEHIDRVRMGEPIYVALAVGGFGVSWLSRLHTGGGVNTIMPALAVTAILFGLAIARLGEAVDRRRDTPEGAKNGLKAVIWLAVIIPTSPYLATQAGKPSTAHHMAVMDLLRATGSEEIQEAFLAEANRELANPRYEAILLYRAKGWFDETPIPEDFEYQGPIIAPRNAFRPKSGYPEYVPSHFFVRCR